MTMHARHPDFDAVLYDNCHRCYQHSEHPFDSLDDSHLGRLASMIFLFEKGRTVNERRAIHEIEDVMVKAARLERVIEFVRKEALNA